MKRDYKKWSNKVLLAGANLDMGRLDKAAQHYDQAWVLAERLIGDAIMAFDGDVRPLSLYNYTCCCLVQVHTRTGDSAAARSCLEQTGRKFLSVLKNSGYPLWMRGKVIREFEPLMNLAIQFYRSEGRSDEAYTTVGDWLTEIKQYVNRVRPVEETVWMN